MMWLCLRFLSGYHLRSWLFCGFAWFCKGCCKETAGYDVVMSVVLGRLSSRQLVIPWLFRGCVKVTFQAAGSNVVLLWLWQGLLVRQLEMQRHRVLSRHGCWTCQACLQMVANQHVG